MTELQAAMRQISALRSQESLLSPVRRQKMEARMRKNKPPQVSEKNQVSLVRSSAAEYLTFAAAGEQSETSVYMRYEDENIWLTQVRMSN